MYRVFSSYGIALEIDVVAAHLDGLHVLYQVLIREVCAATNYM